ncbi:MAG: NUDIX domain-containing protein [Alphaproteobacteria bacterium]|nr:NUDIX domain-containing protein [Alphaproteobacteria bacterium]
MHRVGIIPFDIQDDAVALLFVTSQTRGRWILPKGRQKRQETHVETCHREGFEEAGVRGIVLEDFPFTVKIGKSTSKGVQDVPVTYYPYLVLEQVDDWPEQLRRERHWALIEDAHKVAYREDYLMLIQHFQALREWITKAAKARKAAQQEALSPERL